MMQNVMNQLIDLNERYFTYCQKKGQQWPQSHEVIGEASPCIQHSHSDFVEWCAVPREPYADFSGLEDALELSIHPDVQFFYGSQYSANLPVYWKNDPLTLLQIWNHDDWERLQTNLIGHILFQKSRRIAPSCFIGVTDSDINAISVRNDSGQVIYEQLGSKKFDVLAENLADFLQQLTCSPDL